MPKGKADNTTITAFLTHHDSMLYKVRNSVILHCSETTGRMTGRAFSLKKYLNFGEQPNLT